jgi:serine/threonine-protein kinase
VTIASGTKLGRYEVRSPLGAGAMGEVYLAQDTVLGRRVALKILPREFAADADRMRRFVLEAKSASALNHPNIITIYEVGETDEMNFIATEYIEGQTLNSRGSLAVTEALDVVSQIASALQAAHAAGIIHRDIKPENVIIRPDGLVKILDFGIAKQTGPAVVTSGLASGTDPEAATAVKGGTSAGVIIGTASYMSPEQARGKAIDARSDIFSVGVVLYEMLAGQKPFTGENAMDVIGSIVADEPTPLVQILPSLPPEIDRIVHKALRKKLNERYQTANELLMDLTSVRKRLEFEAEPGEAHTVILATTSGQADQSSVSGTRSERTVPNASLLTTSSAGLRRKRMIFGVIVLLLALVGTVGYWMLTNRATKQMESIAVMPFVNESGNADLEYLSDGMAETLISSLSQLPNLNVKPRSSVFRYKGKETSTQAIGKELNVQAILNGRVVQRGQDLSLFVELIDVALDKVVWSQQYNRKQTDLVTLQTDVARDVSNRLKPKMSGADEAKVMKTYTANPEAYQLYLKGKFYWNKRTGESLKQAVELYRQAIEKDPNYALAYSGLAETYVLFSSYDVAAADDSMPQAKAAALRALAIDDSLAEAHTALGFYLSNYEWDRDGSEKEYRRAIELKPNYATAHHWLGADLVYLKRFDDSLVELRRGEELDPLSPIIGTNLGDTLVFARRYDEAIAQYKRTLVRSPNFAYTHRALGWAYGLKGMYPEAIAETRTSIELNNGSTGKGYLGLWLAKSGKRDEAVKLLNELKQEAARGYVQNYNFALIYIGLGNKEEALNYLEKHMSAHAETANQYAVAPEFDDLRSEPRFKAMLKRIKLPE